MINKEAFVKSLDSHLKLPQCELCFSNEWIVVDKVIHLIVPCGSNTTLPFPHIPTGAIICQNCGNIRLFALKSMKVEIEVGLDEIGTDIKKNSRR